MSVRPIPAPSVLHSAYRSLRAAGRLVLAALWTLVLVALWAPRHAWTRRRPHHNRSWRGAIVTWWARGLTRLLRLRVTARGTPPERPFILVVNHLSYLDVIVLQTHLKAVFVSKAEVSRWPAVGWLARTFGTLFIDRRMKRDVLRVQALVEEALAEGDGVIVFPEGTTSPGERVLPFRAALLDAPARTGRSVAYAALSYATPPGEPPAHLAVCWWGGMDFVPHLWQLLRLPRLQATVVFGDDTVHAEDRRELARHLEARVAARFTPVVEPSADDGRG